MARQARKVHLDVEGEETAYRIESDRYSFAVAYYAETEKRDGSAGEAWYVSGYYGSFVGACKALLREKIREVDAESIQDLIEAIDRAAEEVTEAVKELECMPEKPE